MKFKTYIRNPPFLRVSDCTGSQLQPTVVNKTSGLIYAGFSSFHIDASIDGAPAGTVRRPTPCFSKDYPRTITAHDIGLKDLLDAFYLRGNPPEVILFAVFDCFVAGSGCGAFAGTCSDCSGGGE